jgi:hypothetical protein
MKINALTLFGLVAVTGMMVCYALEARSGWFVLGFVLFLRPGFGIWISAGRVAVRNH